MISPTRELASQIKDEARKFASGSVLRPTVIYGGTSTMHQMADLSRGEAMFTLSRASLVLAVQPVHAHVQPVRVAECH